MQLVSKSVVIMAMLGVASCERSASRQPEHDSDQEVSSLAGGVPMPDEAADLLGKRLDLDSLVWLNDSATKMEGKNRGVTLVRWWTDTCPSCAMSLPAIEQLTMKFGAKGLQTVAVYHPKPPRDVASDEVLRTAKAMGYSGKVAADLQWEVLNRVYLGTGERRSTSVCFLLDGQGVVRYVHPGPAFGPTNDPAKRQLHKDYLNITAAVEALLLDREKRSAASSDRSCGL